MIRLLTAFHRLGVNTALVAGLMLMPAVIGVGYWSDRGSPVAAQLGLRGTLAPNDAAAVPEP